MLHINDRLNEAADDVRVVTVGGHYKNVHLHFHRTAYSTFGSIKRSFYFTKLFGLKSMLFGVVQHVHGIKRSDFSKNA